DIILKRRERSGLMIAFYERALDRLDDRWASRGKTGEDLLPPDHPYAGDIDIFGKGSLFELLCAARTMAGERALAAWLCAPATAETIRMRQQAVQELRAGLDLREDLAHYGSDVRSGVRPGSLASWAGAPRLLTSRPMRAAAVVLAVLAPASLAAWIAWGRPLAFFAVLILEVVFASMLRRKTKKVEQAASGPSRELNVLAGVLARLEREPFESRLLVDLQAVLKEGDMSASRRIAKLERLVGLVQAQRNPLFALITFPVLWGVHLSFMIEDWRERWGSRVPCWLEAVGELEALCSLAAYAYEHPGDPFPEIVEEAGAAVFDAEGLGHSLIPACRCVRNDMRLGENPAIMIVSGSNMSGKSTLLRTVGVNTVLAHAGAPVRAVKLQLSPLAMGATIRILDSIQSGTSRFMSEITRLKQIMDMASRENSGFPVLFLLDEILHGTNSHDRAIGAAALAEALVKAGAIGLMTTHDLALASIADNMGKAAANVHFMDRFEDGKQSFDFKLRSGVVQGSNALKLMRSVGLEV
ncbi:MAG: DNA mismatch repair protein MutS, partial [Pseudomonadota bacterium]